MFKVSTFNQIPLFPYSVYSILPLKTFGKTPLRIYIYIVPQGLWIWFHLSDEDIHIVL